MGESEDVEEAEAIRTEEPDEDDGFLSLEDLRIDRDEDGNIIPEEGTTPMGRKILVKPMPTGANKRIFGNYDDPMKASNADLAEALREFYVKPDFSDVDADVIENDLDRQTVSDFVSGLMMLSGFMRVPGDGTKNKLKELLPDLQDSQTKNGRT